MMLYCCCYYCTLPLQESYTLLILLCKVLLLISFCNTSCFYYACQLTTVPSEEANKVISNRVIYSYCLSYCSGTHRTINVIWQHPNRYNSKNNNNSKSQYIFALTLTNPKTSFFLCLNMSSPPSDNLTHDAQKSFCCSGCVECKNSGTRDSITSPTSALPTMPPAS